MYLSDQDPQGIFGLAQGYSYLILILSVQLVAFLSFWVPSARLIIKVLQKLVWFCECNSDLTQYL